MSYYNRTRRNEVVSDETGNTEEVTTTPVEGRRTTFKKNVPLDKLVPFYANDPDRTNRALADFQELVESHRNGGLRGPIRAAFDEVTGLYYIINGHRSTEASRDAGFNSIDVNVVLPKPGEKASDVQEELFANDNKNRPYKGKAQLRTAIMTRGRILMTDNIKRVWGIIQQHTPTEQDLDWMFNNASPDLIKNTDAVVTYVVLARMKDGEASSRAFQKALFITAMGILNRLQVQREARDYVTTHLANPSRILERALDDGKVPACILSEVQKNKAKKAKNEEKRAKRAKNRQVARSL